MPLPQSGQRVPIISSPFISLPSVDTEKEFQPRCFSLSVLLLALRVRLGLAGDASFSVSDDFVFEELFFFVLLAEFLFRVHLRA
mgnify:CR=1 FL=1